MRSRGWIAAVLVSAASAVAALAWPVPRYPAPPAPVADDQLMPLYQESLDQLWKGWVPSTYPGAERPEVDTVELLPARERDIAYWRCLEEIGFTVTDDPDGISYEAPSDVDQEALTIDQFACEAQYPYEGQLDYLMTVEQRSALYDYYTGFLPSCLAFNGFPVTSAPPSREVFVEASVQWPMWTPYQAVWESGAPDDYTVLERRCPTEPAWRRQVNLLSTVDG